MRELLLAMQNLRRRGLSLRLTALSVMIGLSAVILISSIGKSGKESILETIDGIGISGMLFSHTYSVYDGITFDENTVSKLQACDPALTAMPFSVNTSEISLLSENSSALVWGIGQNVTRYVKSDVLYGRFPTEQEIADATKVAVISESLAARAFSRSNVVGQMISIGKEENRHLYRIIGVIESQTASINMLYNETPDFVYAPYTTLDQYHDLEAGHILVKSDDLSGAEIREKVKDTLTSQYGSNLQLDITNLDQGTSGVIQVADLLTLVLSFSAATSLLVAAVGIASTMLSSVNERRQEIGIMKALGASDLQVAFCFLWESLLTCVIGTSVGIFFCVLTLHGLNHLTPLAPVLDPGITIITLTSTLLLGLMAGTIPSIHAARQDPIDALKNNL